MDIPQGNMLSNCPEMNVDHVLKENSARIEIRCKSAYTMKALISAFLIFEDEVDVEHQGWRDDIAFLRDGLPHGN